MRMNDGGGGGSSGDDKEAKEEDGSGSKEGESGKIFRAVSSAVRLLLVTVV